MSNKCPNCGYEYGENDAFCAMCGIKIDRDDDENVRDLDSELSESKDFTLDNIDFFDKVDDKKGEKSTLNFRNGILDNTLLNFVGIMFIISALISFSLYSVIRSQDTKKLQMRYQNMISNPAQIPELKEPKTFLDLKTDLAANENFLSLYLRFSDDTIQKKEQIFISYLKEMDKLSHITNENLINDDLDTCSSIKNSTQAKKCAKQFTREFRNVGVSAYCEYNTVYLYPDYKFIYKKYSSYLSEQMIKYLKLKAKYPTPSRVGLELQVRPKKIADKIYDFERLYSKIYDIYIRDEVLRTIYNDLRIFIFTPSIYNTTTQEMTKEFRNAYSYFISRRRNSQLRPVIMSYMDKMRSYDELNFKNDYPYKIFEDTFDENVENSSFSDIFAQLRKTVISDNSELSFNFVYSITGSVWKKYENQMDLSQGEFLMSNIDENDNVTMYTNTYSILQEINIPKYSKMFLNNGCLYVFNADRLNISKFIYNGSKFTLQQLNATDITSVFPGVQVINIDSFQNYNIYVEKDNLKSSYIILSRYSQGFDGYFLSSLKGAFTSQGLPNLFTVSGYDDIELSYHNNSVNPNETSEASPTYKIIIHTRGYVPDNNVVKYDEKTANEQSEEMHNPTIMPKIMNNDEAQRDEIENLSSPPRQIIEPPRED